MARPKKYHMCRVAQAPSILSLTSTALFDIKYPPNYRRDHETKVELHPLVELGGGGGGG